MIYCMNEAGLACTLDPLTHLKHASSIQRCPARKEPVVTLSSCIYHGQHACKPEKTEKASSGSDCSPKGFRLSA